MVPPTFYPMNRGGGFAFIVVLFILLIIVGASFVGGCGGGYGYGLVAKNSMKKIEVGQKLGELSSKSVTALFLLYSKPIPSRFWSIN